MAQSANSASPAQRTAWVAGATGLVGHELLEQLALDNTYSRVVALVRRPFDVRSPKIECRLVDFDKLESTKLGPVDDAFCALGTTIKKAGSQSAFYHVDFTYSVAFAKAALAHRAARLCIVSSAGANARSGNFYLRVKGEMENTVANLGSSATHIFRPSFLEGERAEFRLGERILLPLFRMINAVLPRRIRSVPADAVARAMINAAKNDKRGLHIHESDLIQDYRRT